VVVQVVQMVQVVLNNFFYDILIYKKEYTADHLYHPFSPVPVHNPSLPLPQSDPG